MIVARWGGEFAGLAGGVRGHHAEGRGAATESLFRCSFQNAPIRRISSISSCVLKNLVRRNKPTESAQNSSRSSRIRLRQRRIREEIIGRTLAVFGPGAAGKWGKNLASLMLQKPSGDHRGSKLLYPLVQNRPGLLSKIRSVSQPRELVALQAVARCGQQEFPRGKGVVSGHDGSPE